jgi:predicted amidophosphoribosyltransferase
VDGIGATDGRHAAPPAVLSQALTQIARLVLPVSCAGCGAPDHALCSCCRDVLPRGGWRVPELSAAGVPDTWAGGDYAGVLRRVVLAFKDDGRFDLAPVLARCLTRTADIALRDSGWAASPVSKQLLLVPAPSSTRIVRRRGGDLTADLARRAAAGLRRRGWPATALPVLRQRRGMRDQAGLSLGERAGNAAGALFVRRTAAVDGAIVLLVDDVVTTGATLAAGTAALEEAGAIVLAAATVAATPRLRGAAGTSFGVGAGPHPGRVTPGLSVSNDLD